MNGFGEGITDIVGAGGIPVEEEIQLCLADLWSQIYPTNRATEPAPSGSC